MGESADSHLPTMAPLHPLQATLVQECYMVDTPDPSFDGNFEDDLDDNDYEANYDEEDYEDEEFHESNELVFSDKEIEALDQDLDDPERDAGQQKVLTALAKVTKEKRCLECRALRWRWPRSNSKLVSLPEEPYLQQSRALWP
jgi:hypothetical protein